MPDTSYSALHEEACAKGEKTYTDPETGYQVFTRIGLLERDRCCGAGCRHCPFGHDAVSVADRAGRIQQAAWLTDHRPGPGERLQVLFWSGGKDSYLAYRALARKGEMPIVLLTTFDARSRIIAHQEFAIDEVVAQATHLELPVIGVPLHTGVEYLDHIGAALDLVPGCNRLCFGDLHLEHIRKWREDAFGGHPRTQDIALSFPLWNASYDVLLDEFAASSARCAVSAVDPNLAAVSIGDEFGARLIKRLPEGSDAFGENGEFHTRVVFETCS